MTGRRGKGDTPCHWVSGLYHLNREHNRVDEQYDYAAANGTQRTDQADEPSVRTSREARRARLILLLDAGHT
jgi:hypothetical protein